MADLATLESDLAEARAARSRILNGAQRLGQTARSLEYAQLEAVNATIRTLETQIAALKQAQRGFGSLSARIVRPGG